MKNRNSRPRDPHFDREVARIAEAFARSFAVAPQKSALDEIVAALRQLTSTRSS